jgi:hypothetical protein
MAALYPESISILSTGSYTVPAGKYVVVNPSSIGDQSNFSINGVSIVYIKNSMVDLTLPTGTIFTVNNGSVAVIQVYVVPL